MEGDSIHWAGSEMDRDSLSSSVSHSGLSFGFRTEGPCALMGVPPVVGDPSSACHQI